MKDEKRINELMEEFNGMNEAESIHHQLTNWVNGISLHNPILDKCCPDFSCCNGRKILPHKERQKYYEHIKNNLYAKMLSEAFGDEDKVIENENPIKH